MKLGYAVVERNDDLIGELLAYSLDPGLNALKRGQVDGPPSVQVHAIDPPILLTCLVLEVQDVLIGIGPAVEVDAAEGIVRDRLGLRGIIGRTHPYVHDVVYGGKVTNFGSIRAETDRGFVRVAEQGFAWDDWGRATPEKFII